MFEVLLARQNPSFLNELFDLWPMISISVWKLSTYFKNHAANLCIGHCLEKSGQWVVEFDKAYLALAGCNLVQQKTSPSKLSSSWSSFACFLGASPDAEMSDSVSYNFNRYKINKLYINNA